MQALGFDFVIAQDADGVEEACYELPLSKATSQSLRSSSTTLDSALSHVRAL